MNTLSARLNAVAIFGSVAGFAGLEFAAMSLYPGGTWWDATTRGHRFWENFLCDLEWRVALNGTPNPLGSQLATAAMLVLLAGLAAFWLAVPRLFVGRAPFGAVAVRPLGLISVGSTVAVVFMPSERFGALHGAMVIASCLPGLTASALAVHGLVASEPRPRVAGWTGASMLAFALVDFALYASHFLAHREGTALVPALEKVALILLLAWMVLVGVRAGGLWPQQPA